MAAGAEHQYIKLRWKEHPLFFSFQSCIIFREPLICSDSPNTHGSIQTWRLPSPSPPSHTNQATSPWRSGCHSSRFASHPSSPTSLPVRQSQPISADDDQNGTSECASTRPYPSSGAMLQSPIDASALLTGAPRIWLQQMPSSGPHLAGTGPRRWLKGACSIACAFRTTHT